MEYAKLMKLIEDYDNGIYEDLEFWKQVKEIAEDGIYWTHKILQDDL